jgi:hypothetical protein
MVYEISQFDIQDRQLLTSEAHPKPGIWMDIGEAKITRTIFGRPRVRVICERDRKRRARMLWALAVILAGAAAWQGWIALQRALNAPPPLPLSARIRISPPVIDSEDFTPAAKREKSRTQILLEGMATRRPPEPQQPAAKPGKLTAADTRAHAENVSKPGNQTGVLQAAGQADPSQPADSIQAEDRVRAADLAAREKMLNDAVVSTPPPAAGEPTPAPVPAKP